MDDDLTTHLDTIERGECYRVDAMLKESALESTERVYLIVADGTERGPFIRKRMKTESGLGEAYERLWQAQKAGKRFMHLPRIMECGVDGDDRVVIMEYVAGKTLDELVDDPGYTDESAAVIAVLLCDAVMELHECFDPPMIHRDLKPANVIISSSNLTLIDLGIARTFDKDAARDTRSFGTRGYAPPEQFGYGQTDERSDIYALGMLIAYCFLREDPERRLVESEFADERIPESLRPTLARATAFDPGRRYGSVRAMKDDQGVSAMLMEAHLVDGSDGAEGEVHIKNNAPDAPTTPPAPRSVGESSARSNGTFLGRIPRWVGICWNVLVILTWAVFAAAAVSVAFFPTEGDTFASPVARAISSIGIFAVGTALAAFGLLDKRRLKRRLSFLGRFPWWQVLLVCVAASLAVALVSAITGAVMNDAAVFSMSTGAIGR